MFRYPLLLLSALCLLLSAPDLQALDDVNWDEARFAKKVEFDPYVPDGHYQYRKDYMRFYYYSDERIEESFSRHYYRQIASDSTVKELERLIFRSEYNGSFEKFSYRVWKDGEVIYAPSRKELKEQVTYSNVAGVRGQNGVKFIIVKFQNLEAGSVLEVFYELSDILLPTKHLMNDNSQTSFNDTRRSIKRSELEVRYRSSRDLVYGKHPRVIVEDTTDVDIRIYTFGIDNTQPGPRDGYLDVEMGINPSVTFDWRDLTDFYRGETYTNWFDYIPELFYKGDIYDYDEFENWHNLHFGYRIYLGTITTLTYSYSDRPYIEFMREALSFVRASENREVMQAAKDLDLYVDSLIQDTALSIVDAVKKLNNKVNQFVILDLGYKDYPPMVFAHYSLLSKFYFDLLEGRSYPAWPMLIKTKRHGPFDPQFISSQQFNAMAMGFMDKEGKFHFTVLGPYLGSFYEVDYYPGEFSGGLAVAFDLKDEKIHRIPLPQNPADQDGFKKVQSYKVNFAANSYDVREDYEFYGAFQNRIYHEYLVQPDSAKDVLFTSRFLRFNNGVFNKRSYTRTQKDVDLGEKRLKLPLSESRIILLGAMGTYSGALPLPYAVDIQLNIEADQPFELEWIMPQPLVNSAVQFACTEKRWSPTSVSILVKVIVPNHVLVGKQTNDYRSFFEEYQMDRFVKLVPQ